jgi:hypothetical protein
MKKPIYIEESTLLRLKELALEREKKGQRQTLGELATEAINASLNNNTVSRKSSHGSRNSCANTQN